MQAWLSRHRTWLVIAASLGVLAWATGARPWLAATEAFRERPALPAGTPLAGAVAGIVPAPTATTPFVDAPPGATQAQWLALREELRARPGGEAELRRIGDYLTWSDALRRFRSARDDAAERTRLARTLDAGLPARLRGGEITSAEARQIKVALLEVTLDDPAERAAVLQRWIAAEASPATVDPRQLEFDRRQASVVAAWSALPPGARDAAAMERELDALRREVFGTPMPATVR